MQEKKEMNKKVKTILVLVIILLLIITGVYAIIVIKEKNDGTGNNLVSGDMTEPVQNEVSGTQTNEEQSNYNFTMQFLKLENNKKNLVYSPLSIKYALKMLNDGAEGNTKAQIENVIGNLSLSKYNNIDNILSLANGVYIKDTYSKNIKESYKNILEERYNAEINYDSFNNATNVNNWIENKTLGIIKNMLEDSSVQDAKMLLINALAIDMEWKEKFDESDTYGENFYLEDGTKMEASMMHKQTTDNSTSYYKDENVIALSMDLKEYDGNTLEFIAIMPKNDLQEYINTLTNEELDNILNNLTPASNTEDGLDISIPRFSYDYNLKLKSDLINMGITDAFNSELANFSNMSTEELYVSDALHKADIDFTEKGIKAAAATVIVMKEMAILEDETNPIEIKIDNPFMYLIRDKHTGETWFVGTVYEPNSWQEDIKS